MSSSSNFVNHASITNLSQLEARHYLLERSSSASYPNPDSIDDYVSGEDFYRQLKTVPNTVISVQYSTKEFLSFNICKIKQGRIVNSGTKGIALQCQISGKTYTFTHAHFNQMSNRERYELFNYLGLDANQFFSN